MSVIVNCPTCQARVEWRPENSYRPFCSHRCKQSDLGAWAEEKYAIPDSVKCESGIAIQNAQDVDVGDAD